MLYKFDMFITDDTKYYHLLYIEPL